MLSPYSLNSQIHFAFFKKKNELLDSIECLMCCAYASCLFLFRFFFLVYHKPQHLCSAYFIWKDSAVLVIPYWMNGDWLDKWAWEEYFSHPSECSLPDLCSYITLLSIHDFSSLSLTFLLITTHAYCVLTDHSFSSSGSTFSSLCWPCI